MLRLHVALAASALLAGCAASPDRAAEGDLDAVLDAMMSGRSVVSGKALDKALEQAAAHPFGSRENPVRAAGPAGQREYLSRLRCADLKAPQFERGGSAGASPYGNMMDVYQVNCPGSEPADARVFMDMYHAGHVERRPVPGFGIVGGQPSD